ncbi:Hypothetical predicted protein [Pelobates cultripes]|uniref:Uncharacterized protein n=1 Tax=Pelobates cultripes TaxID=61616 RepID=A0AAD1T8A5_PELCU|nr:Hypothetical predicted protein [Pelobates cultripes]
MGRKAWRRPTPLQGPAWPPEMPSIYQLTGDNLTSNTTSMGVCRYKPTCPRYWCFATMPCIQQNGHAAGPRDGLHMLHSKHGGATRLSAVVLTTLKHTLTEAQMFSADIDIVKTEVQAVTAHIQASEEDIIDTQADLKGAPLR